MRTLFGVVVLSMMAVPAFAREVGVVGSIPEPGVLSLVGIGAVAYMLGRRGK